MKRFLMVALALVLCLGFSACGQIEDANGEEDTALATLDKQALLAQMPSSFEMGSVRTTKDGVTQWSIRKFSGVKVLETCTVAKGARSVEFAVGSELEQGNLYVYVYKDGAIVSDLSIGKGSSLTIEFPAAGEYELRVAGESAAFSMTYSITVSE